ncbi:MAG: hypothetical protein JNK75_09240 [Betaproteobacteria bacterium]|nr:hypothetical protein [Betaproteobacteria bacterium]
MQRNAPYIELAVMEIRPHMLRGIFALSVLLTAFWVVGILWDSVAGRDPPVYVLVFVAAMLAAGVSQFAFRGRRLVIPSKLDMAETALSYVPRVIGAYLMAVPVVGLITWLLVTFVSRDSGHPESGILVWLMALWLPLWFAPAIGVEWWWHSIRKRGLA